jgi:hypothetical protein
VVHFVVQKTLDCANLELYHGSAAFNLTQYPEWDSMLWELVALPTQVLTVHAKRRGRGHGGWSKDNPYLQERFVEFDIDIEPPALAQRILSVREQIAREWTSDLETLRVANEMILDSYHAFQAQQRRSETSKTSQQDGNDQDDPENLGSIDQLTAPYTSSAYDKNFKAYDRTAMMVLGNNIVHDGHSSSAYRAGSFDLLGLLATQESVHRILKMYHTKRQPRNKQRRQRVAEDDDDEEGDNEVDSTRDYQSSAEWLHQFYVARLATHFDGNQEYGRADDFLEELLLSPPSVKLTARTGELGLIDPLRMAEDIIAMRSQVAMDWKETVSRVATTDHTELRNMCLALRMMGQTNKREQQLLQPKLPLTSTSATSSAMEETSTTTSTGTGTTPQHMEEFQ